MSHVYRDPDFFKTRTITEQVTVFPVIGKVYRFAGESLSRTDRSERFMIVALIDNYALEFRSGKAMIGWTPIEGPDAGMIFKFHNTEEIEEAFDE